LLTILFQRFGLVGYIVLILFTFAVLSFYSCFYVICLTWALFTYFLILHFVCYAFRFFPLGFLLILNRIRHVFHLALYLGYAGPLVLILSALFPLLFFRAIYIF